MSKEGKVTLLVIGWILGTSAIVSLFSNFINHPVLDWIAIITAIVLIFFGFWLYRRI